MQKTFILIPGRSSRQGVTLNEGKYTDGYIDETSTLRMNPGDMQAIGITEGDEVRMWNDVGSVTVPVIDAKEECPPGLVFICYGDKSSRLMGGETHGSGMPDSKGLDVHIESVANPNSNTDGDATEHAGEAESPTSTSQGRTAKPIAAENETVAGGRPSSQSLDEHDFDREAVDSQPPNGERTSSFAEATRSPESAAAKSKHAPSSSSVSSHLPNSATKKTARKISVDQEQGTASMAQIFAIVLGLITILILLFTSGQ